MKKFSYFFNFPVALFFLVVTLIDPSLALCNGADAIMCCLNTGPASDPLIALQLLLSGVQAPAQDTVIGVGCTPITNTASTCALGKLVGCDDNSHGAIGIGCGLQLQKVAA